VQVAAKSNPCPLNNPIYAENYTGMFNAVFAGKAHVMIEMILKENTKFWEELIAYVF
jgi:hypothetical protein